MISSFFGPRRVKTTIGGITAILTTIGGVLNTVTSVDAAGRRGKPDYVTTAAGLGGGLMLIFAYDKPGKDEEDEGGDDQEPKPKAG